MTLNFVGGPLAHRLQRLLQSLFALFGASSLAISAENSLPSQARSLFLDVPVPGVVVEHLPTVSRHRGVTVDLPHLRTQRAIGSRMKLNFFKDADFEAIVEQVINRGENEFSLIGSLSELPHSSFALSYKDNVVVMNVRTASGMYHLRFVGNAYYEVREIDERKFPPCGNTEKHAVKAEPLADIAHAGITSEDEPLPDSNPDAANIIDVMIVYTPAARAAVGGTAAMEALINLGIDESNVAYQESQITPRLRLVHQREVNYTEAGFYTDHDRLTGTSDGFMDEIHALRNTYGADMVSLLNNDGSYCGLGWQMTALSSGFASSAFTVVYWSCATGYYSLVHELGHNMGCDHDRAASSTGGLYPYSYGWHFTGTNGGDYRTVMAYAPGTRVQRFSNPNVSYFGTPTGVPAGQQNAANNALTINNAASTVANFRQAVIGACTNTALAYLSTNVSFSADSGTVPVSASTDCSWTAVSGSSFITISGSGSGIGNGTFSYSVAANPNPIARTGTVSVASRTFTLIQAAAPGLADALDTSGVTWTTGGHANWFVQAAATHDGVDAAQSGTIIRNQQTYLETTVAGPVTLSFWWKVSSESNDVLKVAVDTIVSSQISGEVSWQFVTLAIPAGTHAIRWTYSKNNNVTGGSDAAWLDQVTVTSPLPPDHLALSAGNNATAAAGSTLAVNPTVQVLDAEGNPVSGVTVNFAVQSGGGSVGSTSVTSGFNGLASTTFTLGSVAGVNRLEAYAILPGSPAFITFTATGIAGPAHHLVVLSQPPPFADAGTPFSQQPVIRVEDQYGNLRATDNSLLVTASRASGNGSLQGSLAATAANGIATFNNLFHTAANEITIAFTSAGVVGITSAPISINAVAAQQLAFDINAASAVAGSPFLVQPVLSTRDQFGNHSSIGLPDSLLVTVQPTSVTDILLGNVTVDLGMNAGRGVAAFQDLRLDMAGPKQLRAVADRFNTITGEVFTVTPASFTKLQILLPGEAPAPATIAGKTGSAATQNLDVPFTVRIRAVDNYFNLQSGVTDIIAVASSDLAADLPLQARLTNSVGEFSLNLHSPGNQIVTANDISNPHFGSDTTVVPLNAAATSALLTSSANPAQFGDSVTFTCTVAMTPARAGSIDGTVQFRIDGVNIGVPVSISNGAATFTANLPAGSHTVRADYLGTALFLPSTTSLVSDQFINTAPVAYNDYIHRLVSSSVKVFVATLLTNDFDSDGDLLSFVSCSSTTTNGATVTLANGWLFYQPAAGFTNIDSVPYTITDGRGGFASAYVRVRVIPTESALLNVSADDISFGAVLIHLNGIPGRIYRLQYTRDFASGEWQDLTSATADENGIIEFSDSTTDSTRFYRALSE